VEPGGGRTSSPDTPGGAPYGIYLDEMDDDHLPGMITPGRSDQLSALDLFGP